MRVVLADDNHLLRAGVAELLALSGFEVVGQAARAEDVMSIVRGTRPDVAVLDIRMPPTHSLEGLELARSIRSEFAGEVGVVLLSQYIEAHHALDLITDGVAGFGYLLKDRVLDPDQLADAIRRVGDGGSAIDPVVIEQLLRRQRANRPLAGLTDREREVLEAMAEGLTNVGIAGLLHISEKTVESCSTRIFMKLGLDSDPVGHRRVQAVLAFLSATSPEL